MTPQPLDYERIADASDRPMTARRWAMSLAIVAIVMDGIALSAGMGGDGMGWALAFPCLFANGLLVPICACVSVCFGIVSISCRRGRDGLAWLAVFLATGAAYGAICIAKWSADAVTGV